jgi:hypothetical protein
VFLIYRACRAMDPSGPEAFADPLIEACGSEKTRLSRKLAAREAATAGPSDLSAGRAALLAIVAGAVGRLEAMRQERAAIEPAAAAILAAPLCLYDREMLERLRLHQVRLSQTFLRTVEALRKLRKEFGEVDAADEEPEEETYPIAVATIEANGLRSGLVHDQPSISVVTGEPPSLVGWVQPTEPATNQPAEPRTDQPTEPHTDQPTEAE